MLTVVTSVKFLVARLCREREGRRAEVGVGVGGNEESQGGSTDPQQDSGVRLVLHNAIDK